MRHYLRMTIIHSVSLTNFSKLCIHCHNAHVIFVETIISVKVIMFFINVKLYSEFNSFSLRVSIIICVGGEGKRW